MREIKFRAWEKINGSWLDMNSGYFYLAPNGKLWEIYKLRNGVTEYNEIYADIQFYTGLKDCKGREIYEGDIVKTEEYFGGDDETDSTNLLEVRFESGRFITESSAFVGCIDLGDIAFQCEVIGNIYENKELLK